MFKFDYFTICPNISSGFTILFSWIVLFTTLPAVFKLFKNQTISSQIIIVLYFISFIPSSVLLEYSYNYLEFSILISIYWILFLHLGALDYSVNIKIKHAQTPVLLYIILAVTGFVILYVSYKYTGFRIQMSLIDVYDIRFESRNYDFPTAFTYILASSGTVLSLGFLYFLIKKKYFFAACIIILFVIDFGIGGHKSVIFKLFVSILGYILYKKERVKYFPIFFIALAITSLIIPSIGSLFGFRVLMLPASIHYAYYEFFNIHELDFLREGILSSFGLDTPYKDGIMYIIGEYTTGDLAIAANNGLFSDAYMNFGYFGVVLYPFILTLFLKIVDRITEGVDFKLLFGLIFSFASCLNSATFTVSLLTGGLLLSLLFILSIPNKLTSYNQLCSKK